LHVRGPRCSQDGEQSQTFLAISGATGTGTDPSLAGNSAFRLNVIAT